ncbi:MAG: O-sialoglycoprotein endopeptidase [Firmicutes bacterium]|nr:O-sialoglycoprotein endopeptidase [Bacillota bacterium]
MTKSHRYFMGIDTSNYTTSNAVVNCKLEVVADHRKVLNVPKEQRGLRQSEALFQHVKNLPELFEQLQIDANDLVAITASSRPRPVDNSYMPVFVPGVSFGRSLAAVLQIPFKEISHQETHIWSGLLAVDNPPINEFLVLQLSGGTSELLKVRKNDDLSFTICQIGSTIDLNAGQFIDRIGVLLGLDFPAGAMLEELANKASSSVSIPSYHKQGKISFAGPLTATERLIREHQPEDIALGVFSNIFRTIKKLLEWAMDETKISDVLFVGGVASNSIIRTNLSNSFRNHNFYFAEPKFCRDNAIGSAFYAAQKFR